jgi:hypothetical protein
LCDFLEQHIPRFYFALHHSGEIRTDIDTGEQIAVWGVVVLVSSLLYSVTEHYIELYKEQAGPEIPIRVGVGQFQWLSSTNRERQQYPTPGASIGVDGDYENSVTLGGYVVAEKSREVYAMSVGHMCFSEPQPPNSPPTNGLHVNRLTQPSIQDCDGELKELQRDLESFKQSGDKEMVEEIESTIAMWWQRRAKNGFAEPVMTSWTSITDPSDPNGFRTIQDISLSKVFEMRRGANRYSSLREFCPTSIRGIGEMVKERRLFKVGRSTGYTEGWIQSMEKVVFRDVNLHQRLAVFCLHPYEHGGYAKTVEMGDSGSWIVDMKGGVVGMITGAVAEEKKEGLEKRFELLGQAIFMPIGDCLKVCEDFLKEKFVVLAG